MKLRSPVHPSVTESDLTRIFGQDRVSRRSVDRITYSRDLWPRGMLWSRQGRVPHPPDWIVWPEKEEQIVQLLDLANRKKVPIIPYGAGSGVCGGTVPIQGGIILDLKRMTRVLEVKGDSLLATAECGINGQVFETELNRRGFTMGHFPSSIYCSTLGGWIATRSAGQLSTRYGKIEDMVLGVRAVLASGEIYQTRITPRRATGPDLVQLLVGSEGTLGVLTQGTVRIHRLPESRRFRGIMFQDVESGMETIRQVLQQGLRPAAVRLYDELDTFLVGSKKRKKPKNGLAAVIGRVQKTLEHQMIAWPELVGYLEKWIGGRCLLIFTFEGQTEMTRLEDALALECCESNGGRDLGPGPARHWWDHRYDVSYQQSALLEKGYFVDTFEVATTWEHLPRLYRQVREALSGRVVVMAHFSHAYPEGCSIYFTFAGRGSDETETEALYEEVWNLAMEAAMSANSTLSHHHGVGLSKAPFMGRELGPGLGMLRKIKAALDPNGILNPGKLGM